MIAVLTSQNFGSSSSVLTSTIPGPLALEVLAEDTPQSDIHSMMLLKVFLLMLFIDPFLTILNSLQVAKKCNQLSQ